MPAIEILDIEKITENTFQATLSVDGQNRKHVLTIAAPIRVIQAGPDMDQYPESVRAEVYRRVAAASQKSSSIKESPCP